VPRPRHVVWPHKYAPRCLRTPIERIESLRPALRIRVLVGGTDTDEREVVRYMGDASRADRYRLLVGESCVEGVGARVGLLADDQLRQLRKRSDTAISKERAYETILALTFSKQAPRLNLGRSTLGSE
jgi:hypothetical protein